MSSCAEAAVVIAKILSQGASRVEALDDEFSTWFSIEYRGKVWSFQIPTPLEDGGYSQYHLETIEVELQKLGLDLLPLDHNLLQ
jgi:hypothetical protein